VKKIGKVWQSKFFRNYVILIRNSINLIKKEDRFINSHTTKVYDPPSSSSRGSSTHSSSSGRSHGGGGRSF